MSHFVIVLLTIAINRIVKMKNLVFGLLFFFVLHSPLASQDAQFYQVFASPLTLNPAMTGMIDGNFRISGVYRDQWRALVDKPFSTFAMSGDGRFSISKKRKDNSDYVGVGLYFQSDKVGTIAFTTNQLGISSSIHKSLDDRLNQYLSFGVQISINQRNINYENLNFGDEFNGINGYTDPTGEILPVNNFGFSDIALGLNYTISPSDEFDAFAGVSLYHATAPVITFDRNTSTSISRFVIQENIYRKYQIYGGLSYKFAKRWDVIPRGLFVKQGPHQQLVFGSHLRRNLIDSFSSAVEFGLAARVVNDVDATNLESAILSLGIDLSGKLIGLSYELGLSSFSNRFRNQGVIELSFRYTGEYDNDVFFCPEF